MTNTTKNKDARALLTAQRRGVLSTHSVEAKGYPFGSVTPYTLDQSGHAVILISNLAQHFKNIRKNPKVSLTVFQEDVSDVLASGRLTYLGDVAPLASSDQGTRERYYRFFPESIGYAESHGFYFFELKPVKLRFIGGFGNISWIEPKDFFVKSPFSSAEEKGILTHMNQDHKEAVTRYVSNQTKIDGQKIGSASMVGIDGEGIDVLANGELHRIPFDSYVSNTDEARKVLVAMAKAGFSAGR